MYNWQRLAASVLLEELAVREGHHSEDEVLLSQPRSSALLGLSPKPCPVPAAGPSRL